MKKDHNIISTHALDAEKKDVITRSLLEKILREIKSELVKNGKLEIIIRKI
jgi:hypothetical protein